MSQAWLFGRFPIVEKSTYSPVGSRKRDSVTFVTVSSLTTIRIIACVDKKKVIKYVCENAPWQGKSIYRTLSGFSWIGAGNKVFKLFSIICGPQTHFESKRLTVIDFSQSP